MIGLMVRKSSSGNAFNMKLKWKFAQRVSYLFVCEERLRLGKKFYRFVGWGRRLLERGRRKEGGGCWKQQKAQMYSFLVGVKAKADPICDSFHSYFEKKREHLCRLDNGRALCSGAASCAFFWLPEATTWPANNRLQISNIRYKNPRVYTAHAQNCPLCDPYLTLTQTRFYWRKLPICTNDKAIAELGFAGFLQI